MRKRLGSTAIHAGGRRIAPLWTYGLEPWEERELDALCRRRFKRKRPHWHIARGKADDILTWEEQLSKVVFP